MNFNESISSVLSIIATDLSLIIEQIQTSHDLDYLRHHYSRHGLTIPFDDAKKHYIGHLLATIAAENVQLSPPLHVDVLWQGHLLETKRWRVFEKLVIEKYNCSLLGGRQTIMEHIDYSVVDGMSGRNESLQKTRSFYEELGLQYINDGDNHNINDNVGNIGQVHLIHDSTLSGSKRDRSEDKFRVYVQDPAGHKTMFIIRKSTEVSKLASVYARKKGISNPKDIRLLFEGDNINECKGTMEEIGVKDQDLIHAHFEHDECEEMFMVKVQNPQGDTIHFTVNRRTKASKIISAYARSKRIHPNFIRLRFNGDCINESTMGDLGVEHLDTFHVVLEQN